MGNIIIGNICSLLAMGTDTVSASGKTTKSVLLVQVISQLFYGIGAVVLKGYSAAVQNAVNILRNLGAVWTRCPKAVEWILVALGVCLGIVFNNRGPVGWLPVAANLLYSLAILKFENNEYALKIAFCISNLMYAVFSGAILNFVGVVTNSIVTVTTVIFLIKARKNRV